MNEIIDLEYKSWIYDLKKRYKSSQIKATVKVNSELLKFYWSLGKDIVTKQCESKWGSSFFANLSRDLKIEIPNAKGFSVTNLKYMKYCYELFSKEAEIRQQVVDVLGLIPWGHIYYIIKTCKSDSKKALFYVHKTIENNWSRAVLLNFLDTDLYERQGKAITNFSETLPAIQGELAQQLTKDPYNFDFLTLSERYNEKELKDALMDNITKFLLELGNGFAFVGREVRLEVGETEKFIDMLFYNIKLHCYVVLEVKVSEFDSSYAGQLSTYVVAVNHQLKGPEDKPTIGLLVCKSLDKVEAQYALEATSQPIGVSGYELYKLIPENFKGSLPSIEEIEAELGKLRSE